MSPITTGMNVGSVLQSLLGAQLTPQLVSLTNKDSSSRNSGQFANNLITKPKCHDIFKTRPAM